MTASQNPQLRTSPPQGLSEEALKEALQVPSIWVESQDLQDSRCQEVEREVALLSPFIQREVLRSGHGLSQADPVILPKQVNPDVLTLLLDYCRFHRAPGRSDKERKLFDEKFIRLDTRRLCELTSAADALDMKPLVDLTSRALARMIEGKSAEEIRETFHLPDDLTEEEKLEPVKNATADPRIRLLNRLYAKKRKELAHKKAAELAAEARARKQAQPPSDDRPLEDLLSFIGTEPAGGKSKHKHKKKRSRKKSGTLQTADTEELQEMEARPSSDPLPAGVTANLVEAAIPSCNTSPSTQSASPSGADQENDKAAPAANTATQPLSLPSGNAGEMVVREPSANPSEGTAATQDIVDLVLPSQPAQAQRQHPQLQNQHPQLQEAMPASHKSGHAAAQNSRQANGHLSPESSPHGHSMDEDDAALLADMQGFASALGCDWQVRGSDMRSLGTLPLPGAHITTLTSLANFKPNQANPRHDHTSDFDSSSHISDTDSEQSELDSAGELEAAYDNRQATNLRESNLAYDNAMSRVAAEDSRPRFGPRWPDDPSHASHASLDDWAVNGSHANGTPSTLTSQGSFSFTNGCPELSSAPADTTLQQHTLPLAMPWLQRNEANLAEKRDELDFGAVQQLLQEFLQQTGLEQHMEIKAKPATNEPQVHCKRNVTVQNVLPCGSFMKIQLN